VCLSFSASHEEGFHGFGERFNALDQRGKVVDSRVFEQYLSQGTRSYIPIPFFLSSRGYSFFADTVRWSEFDLCSADPKRWSWCGELDESESMELHFDVGSPAELMGRRNRRTGGIQVPPKWAFGPWMSSNEWNSQERVMAEVAETEAADIPATVLVIEAWSDESTFYIWNDADYAPKPGAETFRASDFTFPHEGRWPDPKGMIDALHARDTKLVLWQIPVLKDIDYPHPQAEADWQHAEKSGLVAKLPGGDAYRIRSPWFNGGLLWDVTSAEAREWWLSKRRYLVEEMGVDGFKTDGGEHLWGYDVSFASGETGAELWNTFPNRYIAGFYGLANEYAADGGITFSRAGFTGAARTPLHWAGDQASTWEAFRSVYRATLNVGASGVPFFGWDIGGFSGPIPSAELYLRSAQTALLSPLMQYHSEYNDHEEPHVDRTPWNIARRTGEPNVIAAYRLYAKLRMELLDYIHAAARTTARTGVPLMRPLWLDYPDDPQCRHIFDQHLFGPDLLAAPILNSGADGRRMYLPAGEWSYLWTGKRVTGPAWMDVDAPVHLVPAFARSAGEAWRKIETAARKLLQESGLSAPEGPRKHTAGGAR
jgi:alpha-glucosidase (family GH31 glycosyl hydrolase)